MFDFVGKRRWFLLGSAIIILAGIISLAIPGGLKTGIEFQAGTSFDLAISESVTLDDLIERLTELGYGEAIVQEGEDYYYVSTPQLSDEEQEELKSELEDLGLTVAGVDFVSPIVARETIRNAGIAVGVAAVAILLYVTWAFRKMPHRFRYGICAIFALLHDVLVILGLFSLLSRAFQWEIDPMFVTATLAVIGYSVNDTIVVFDRIRENLRNNPSTDFRTTVNTSLYQTLGRSISTSLTTLLVVLAIYLFIGGTIRNFALVLLMGVVAGTYSSIFIASQMLVVWEREGRRGFLPQRLFRGKS